MTPYMSRSPRILFAGGGTGGHVYPAIAIAEAVKSLVPHAAIEFAGTQDRIEWEVVPKAGYAIHPISVSGLQRSFSLNSIRRNLVFPFKLAKGLLQSWRLVKGFDPDVVVGTGGYVSGPVLRMASLQGKPIVIQEQNAYAGVTNKILGAKAARIHIAFEDAAKNFPAEKCLLSGNPTRKELQNIDRGEARAYWKLPADAQVLLMFGGSLGSPVLNKAMRENLAHLLAQENLYILWQTGKQWFDRLQTEVSAHPRLQRMKYVDRMDYAYAAADLVVCRAGAISCSELMVTGSPAVLIPSPHVAEDHQTKNAMAMSKAGAAKLLPETDLYTNYGFISVINELLQNPQALTAMRTATRSLAKPHAAREIAQDVLKIAGFTP